MNRGPYIIEAENSQYIHISFGRYKKKGQEGPDTPTYKKDASGKFVKMGGDATAKRSHHKKVAPTPAQATTPEPEAKTEPAKEEQPAPEQPKEVPAQPEQTPAPAETKTEEPVQQEAQPKPEEVAAAGKQAQTDAQKAKENLAKAPNISPEEKEANIQIGMSIALIAAGMIGGSAVMAIGAAALALFKGISLLAGGKHSPETAKHAKRFNEEAEKNPKVKAAKEKRRKIHATDVPDANALAQNDAEIAAAVKETQTSPAPAQPQVAAETPAGVALGQGTQPKPAPDPNAPTQQAQNADQAHSMKDPQSGVPQGRVMMDPEGVKKIIAQIAALGKSSKPVPGTNVPADQFDLCTISVPGTNQFCQAIPANKEFPHGIPRAAMPQLKTKIRSGSPVEKDIQDAAKAGKIVTRNDGTQIVTRPDGVVLEINEKTGEVNAQNAFMSWAKKQGISISVPATMNPSELRSTQAEISGQKVAGMATALGKNRQLLDSPNADKTSKEYLDAKKGWDDMTAPIFISPDGYILDGHHRWAAIQAYNLLHSSDKNFQPLQMKVQTLNNQKGNLKVNDMIDLSNKFGDEYGLVRQKAHETKNESVVPLGPYLVEAEFKKPKITKEEAKAIGDSIGVDWKEIDLDQLTKGIAVEMEHSTLNQPDTDVIGGDWKKVAKISVAHLRELSDYYDRLEKMEEGEYKDEYGRPSAAKRGYGHSWRKKREEVIERDGKKCTKCGKRAKEVDHITPKSRKGKDIGSNLRVLCADCHRQKTKKFDQRDGRAGYGEKK